MAWLPTNGLIRNFTVVVANIAEGPTPAKQLKVLRPSAPFRIVSRNGGTFADPRSYDRYTTIADAIASVDPAGGRQAVCDAEAANRGRASRSGIGRFVRSHAGARDRRAPEHASHRRIGSASAEGHRLRLRRRAPRVADAGAEAAAAHGPAQRARDQGKAARNCPRARHSACAPARAVATSGRLQLCRSGPLVVIACRASEVSSCCDLPPEVPRVRALQLGASRGSVRREEPMAKSGKVLVVDDYEPNLRGLGQLLEKADYTVLTATNGRDALEIVRTRAARPRAARRPDAGNLRPRGVRRAQTQCRDALHAGRV